MFRKAVAALALLLFTAWGNSCFAAPRQVYAGAGPSLAPFDLNALIADAQSWLVDLIRINTTNPPGNEGAAAQYVAAILTKENIASEVIEVAPGRSIVIGRLQAGPLPNPATALLLLGHLDVVAADKAKWSTDPFAGTIKDGYLYGRGAIDDKGMVVANLATIVALKRSGARLGRDVIFLADDDAEQNSGAGLKQLIDKYWTKFACGFAINTGGRVVLKDGKVQYVGIEASEKVPYDVVVVASGPSGSSALPRQDSAVNHLAAAIAKISEMKTPGQLLTITRRYFEQLSQIADEDTAKWMRALETERFDLAVLRLSEMDPAWGAMLHDTVAVTELRAGMRADVVPAEALANLEVDVLPGDPIGAVVDQMEKTVNDPHIKFQVQTDANVTAPPSAVDSELYQAITHAVPKEFPGVPALPMLSNEATDLSELRLHNVQALGLLPFPMTDAEAQKAHGDDERLALTSFHTGVEFLFKTVSEFATAK